MQTAYVLLLLVKNIDRAPRR